MSKRLFLFLLLPCTLLAGAGLMAQGAGQDADIEDLLAQLEARMAAQPDDLEGWLLLAGMVALLAWMTRYGLGRGKGDPLALEFEAEIPRDMPTGYAILWLAVGLIVLPLSSSFLVDGAVYVARSLHVSEAVIGLTIIAFGTSLPELAAALTSALRQEDDLAIGNVIGSNMFNILGVLGIAATVKPVAVDALILKQDFPVMFLFTVLLFFMALRVRGPGRINRRSGMLLLFMFVAYQVLVWTTAARVP